MKDATLDTRIIRIADVIAQHSDPDEHARLVLAGAAFHLARRYGVAQTAEELYQMGEAYADQIQPKWTPRDMRRPGART